MTAILDFLYLDVRRLESFASQMFSGLPSEATKEAGHEAEFAAGVKGGIPFIAEGSGDTKAVFSASSSVTSRVHHFLVRQVLDELRARNLLASDADRADDGAFVLLEGRLQIVDPRGLAATLRLLPPMLQAVSFLQQTPEVAPKNKQTSAEKRMEADRRRREQQEAATQSKQFKTFAEVTDTFGGETVRVRVLEGGTSLATAVVERDKFVESLDRLVLRHGYLTGGDWRVIGQINRAGREDFYQPGGANFLDLLEQGGIAALQSVTSISAGSDHAWTLTPLAIYREIPGS